MLGKFALAAAIAVPALIGGVAGFMINQHTMDSERARGQAERAEEVRAQSRMLADSLLDEVETLRGHAIGFYQLHAGLDPSILHWSELSIGSVETGLRPEVRQSVTNPDWRNPAPKAILDGFLAAAIKQLSLADLREHGISILRVKKDPQSQAEWIAFAFPVPSDPHVVLLALTEASRIFTSFARWPGRSEAGRLRSYLIGSDGYVLAHSNPAYAGADFSDTSVFREAMHAMLNGQRLNGIGDWQTVDRLPAVISYLRLGSLPIGVVVERVIDRNSGVAWNRIAGEAFELFSLLAILVGLEVWGLTYLQRHGGVSVETELTPVTQDANQAAQIAEIPTVQEIVRINDVQLDEAIGGHTQASQALREERFLVSQFESDALNTKDTRRLSVKLALATSKVFHSPVLFFGYNESIQAATLEAHAGFSHEKPAGTSCPIPQSVLKKIFEMERQGPLVSMADYHPLMALLNTRHFEAWAVTGFAPEASPNGGGPRLIGILVVLSGTPSDGGQYVKTASHPSLLRLMKATGLSYENTLLS